jgi:hypothetical protein
MRVAGAVIRELIVPLLGLLFFIQLGLAVVGGR